VIKFNAGFKFSINPALPHGTNPSPTDSSGMRAVWTGVKPVDGNPPQNPRGGDDVTRGELGRSFCVMAVGIAGKGAGTAAGVDGVVVVVDVTGTVTDAVVAGVTVAGGTKARPPKSACLSAATS
jgi:hypothetical protein